MVIGARRMEGFAERVRSSAARIVLVDCSDGGEALDWARALLPVCQASGRLLLLLAAAPDGPRLQQLSAIGADQLIDLVLGDEWLALQLRQADRLAARLRPLNAAEQEALGEPGRALGSWQWRAGRLAVDDRVAKLLGEGQLATYPRTAMLRWLSPSARRNAMPILRFLRDCEGQRAIVDQYRGRPLVHHIRRQGARWSGQIEWLAQDRAGPRASRDPVTGLADRTGARERLAAMLEETRAGEALNMALFGLRRLDSVNAGLGEPAGNRLLSALAERLVAGIETPDRLVARIGGGDFLLARRGSGSREALEAEAHRMLRTLAEPLQIDEADVRPSWRAALALAERGGDGDALLARLSVALAEAHRRSDAQIAWVRADDDLSPLRLEADLTSAVERGEIVAGFQPQFDVETGECVGAEALGRWFHPQLGELGADMLFPIAERSDLTALVSREVRRVAMAAAAVWPAHMAAQRLSLNLTAEDLASERFVADESALIAAAGFPAERLTYEVTESALIGDLDRAAAQLQGLRDLGCRIAIDDFGTGYSNMLYLKSLPLDYLKLDRAMIAEIARSERGRIICRSVIALAQALGLKVIAEGVETETQLALLAAEDCDIFQGYLRSGPLSNEDFAEFVRAG